MSCPHDPVDSSMTYPDDENRKSGQEILEEISKILQDFLYDQSDCQDALLPLIYEINARTLRILMQYQPHRDHDTRVGRRKSEITPNLDRIIKVTAERAARVIADALAHWEDGWRLETINHANGSTYARWRRSNGSGKRETRYLGVVSSVKDQ